MLNLNADSEANQELLGAKLAQAAVPGPGVIYLQGELGTGKTTLVRGFMRGLGYVGNVRSPTYTIVEPYQIGEQLILHLDLHRIKDPRELEFLGLEDMADATTLWLIEWPQRGADQTPIADLTVELYYQILGRNLAFTANSTTGMTIIDKMQLG
ncbi:hypothetical protein TI04_04820 [Achromatium sp. WMS2]|nr:hypothetical protein TI04_04820 [Achromatium sp. WMS2]